MTPVIVRPNACAGRATWDKGNMKRERPTPAAVAAYEAGLTRRQIADIYGCTEGYVHRVLGGREPAPARFRKLLVELTGKPEGELFPAGERV